MNKKIAYYCISTHLGGAERSLLDEVTHLEESSAGRYTPWLIFPKTEGPLIEEVRKERLEYTTVKMPEGFLKASRRDQMQAALLFLGSLPQLSGYFLRLRRLLQRHQPDLIHTTGIKCHLLTGLLAKDLNLPTLWHLRDIITPGRTQSTLKMLLKQSQVHVTANSQATAASLDPLCPVIYNGISRQKFVGPRESFLQEKLGLPTETPLVGIIGVIAHWKGHKEFLQICRRLIENDSPAHFVIVGDEIYDTTGDRGLLQQLKSEVQAMNCADRIHFMGFLDDTGPAFRSLDVLVHASTQPEPFGRVVVEAMAARTPVVAANDGGIKEIVVHEDNGLLCPPGDTEAYTQAIERLLADRDLSQSLAQKGFETFENKFSLEAHLKGLIEIYDRLT